MEHLVFTTERLKIRLLQESDRDYFFDMMSNPNVMNPIPQDIMSKEKSDDTLNKFLTPFSLNIEKKVWAITALGKNEFIGIAALLINDNHEDEIGYRLREKYWGVGYGTEIAKGLIKYAFENLQIDFITADVNMENTKSIKILDKLFKPEQEFFNPSDNCMDRRYKLYKKDWLEK